MAATSRDKVIESIAKSSLDRQLGLFVGSGFSKAATGGTAPNWIDLLKNVAKRLKLGDPFEEPKNIVGRSLPAIATLLTEQLEDEFRPKDGSLNQQDVHNKAVHKLKLAVAQCTRFTPDESLRAEFSSALVGVGPTWCVTTNYDFVIEELLPYGEALLPEQIMRGGGECIPVYHLHGHRLCAESIVITEQDYLQILRKLDYRHAKLALLLAESTVLMIGYAIGDINVQLAIDLANSMRPTFEELRSQEQGQIIFLNYTVSPQDEPRYGAFGECIIDTQNVCTFLNEVANRRTQLQKNREKLVGALNELVSTGKAGNASLDKLLSNANDRKRVFRGLKVISGAISITDISQMLQGWFEEIARKASQPGNWSHYNIWLAAVLDLIEEWPLGQLPAALFEHIARELDAVGAYIDADGNEIIGNSYEATKTWTTRKAILLKKPRMFQALHEYAEREGKLRLERLLKSIEENEQA